MLDVNSLSDIQKAMILVPGAMSELEKHGIIETHGPIVTAKGIALYDQIHASGWRPSDEQIYHCLNAYYGKQPNVAKMIIFVRDWLNGRIEAWLESQNKTDD